MLGFIKGLFGSDKIVDGLLSGADKIILTNEERMDWTLKYLAATKGQSPTRRFIATGVFLLWGFLLLAGLALKCSGFTDQALYVKESLEIVSPVFGVIIAFYFVVMLKK